MAEKLYYHNKFQSSKNNISKTWQVIKSIINTDSNKHTIEKLTINNKIVCDNNTMANNFNNFFTNIGPNLASKIPLVNDDVTKYITGCYSDSMFLNETNPDEIMKLVALLKTSPSCGNDDISATVVKSIITEIADPLCFIINLSFASGRFPDLLKIAKIVPIHKSEDKLQVTNYRPISILPFFSKIFERLMYNRLLKYLTQKSILVQNQYGFREKHSTYMALLNLVDDISDQLDKKKLLGWSLHKSF